MATNNFFRSNLNRVYHVVQNSMLVHTKEFIIASLRDYFAQETYYRYVPDQWGFPKTVDQTDLPLGAGMTDTTTTRLFIGENYRFDGIFFPAILVKAGSFRSVPVSINREQGKIQYDFTEYQDGYGNSHFYTSPTYFVLGGAWEGNMQIDIMSRSLRARDDLAEIMGIFFVDIGFETFKHAGIIIKPPTIGASSEGEDRNDKLFRQSITFDTRVEWKRQIPIGNLIESIIFSVDFGRTDTVDYPISDNLSIKTQVSLVDSFIF